MNLWNSTRVARLHGLRWIQEIVGSLDGKLYEVATGCTNSGDGLVKDNGLWRQGLFRAITLSKRLRYERQFVRALPRTSVWRKPKWQELEVIPT